MPTTENAPATPLGQEPPAVDALPAYKPGKAAKQAERDRVAATLTANGWDIPDAQANIVWMRLGRP